MQLTDTGEQIDYYCDEAYRIRREKSWKYKEEQEAIARKAVAEDEKLNHQLYYDPSYSDMVCMYGRCIEFFNSTKNNIVVFNDLEEAKRFIDGYFYIGEL